MDENYNTWTVPRLKAYLQVSQLRSIVASALSTSSAMDTSLSAVVSQLNFTDEDFQRVEEATRGQHKNATWHALRRQLITASNFYRVTKKCEARSYKESNWLMYCIADRTGAWPIKRHQWPAADWLGEEKGKEAYCYVKQKKHVGFEVKATGLYMPFLGCSSDGLVSCHCPSKHSDKLLEIKCPYTQRLSHPTEAAKYCGCEVDPDSQQWRLRKTHQYYAQVQGQLTLTLAMFISMLVNVPIRLSLSWLVRPMALSPPGFFTPWLYHDWLYCILGCV